MQIGQMVRQGDVLLMKVAGLPENIRRHEPENGRLVVECGEATGHAHVLNPTTVEGYDILSAAGGIVGQAFSVVAPTPLVHDEHAAIILEPGIYERWYQVEDDGASEQRVHD